MNEQAQQEQNRENNTEQIKQELGEVLSSYDQNDFSTDALIEIVNSVKTRIEEIRNNELPPVEDEIDLINRQIESKREDLQKAKDSTVFVNDVSEDVEFHYSDHKVKFIEDEIKGFLNNRYAQEKIKFKILEELEELEARNGVCDKLVESNKNIEEIDNLINEAVELQNDLEFDIENYESVTQAASESLEDWDYKWNSIIHVIGNATKYQDNIKSLFEYFESIKKDLEEKDPESRFVSNELTKYPELETELQDLINGFEGDLMSTIAGFYELISNYEVNDDYLPENKSVAMGKLNRVKQILMSMRSNMDSFKLDYKDLRKTLNNILILLNRATQSIENYQKVLKSQQDSRIKKVKDIINLISKSKLEALKNSTSEINNMINNLSNLNASTYEIEALQYYFSLKAGYPVDDDAKEEIIDGLNNEINNLHIMEIDKMCLILEVGYDPKKGFYETTNSSPKQNTPKNVISKESTTTSNINSSTNTNATSQPEKKGKTGNLDFLGNMYLKEAQRSKGQWAAKSYLKAIDAFMKCAETQEDLTTKLTFLKQALKAAKEALAEKEDSSTLNAYAIAYRELAYNHSSKLSIQGQVKIGDNFVNAGKHFLREENITHAKDAYKEAYEAYKKVPSTDPLVKSRISAVEKFLK